MMLGASPTHVGPTRRWERALLLIFPGALSAVLGDTAPARGRSLRAAR